MTFNASLRLNSAGFKKGVSEVKSALAGLKSSFLSLAGALGAGLGLTQFISNMKDTAVQLSSAQNVLKNVSKVTKEYTDGVNKGSVEINNYAENLAYVRRLAKDYSQDLIGLTANFAKFHAACDKTNLSLEAQKDVFEALTRAAAYYHMSGDQANDMTLAITQMMSKGKVTSEELRRQLGNSLPGAFNLMAAAIGVTTAQLEDMMKKGEVISSEALPRFAAMLNTVTKNADFDSLQMSINRLKNTWTEFVENSGAENMFKGVIKGADSALGFISRNIREVSSLLKGLVAGIVGGGVFKYLKKRSDKYIAEVEAQLAVLPKKYEKAAKEALKSVSGEGFKLNDPRIRNKFVHNKGVLEDLTPNQLRAVHQYTDAIVQLEKAESNLGRKKGIAKSLNLSKTELQNIKDLNTEVGYLLAKTGKIETNFVPLGKKIGAAFKGIGMQIKGIVSSMGAMAVVSAAIAGLTAIYSYWKKIHDEQKRVNGLVDEYKKSLQLSSQSVDENSRLLQKNVAIMQDETKNAIVRKNALAEINKMMGTSYTTDALDKTKKAYQDIVKEVERWIEATKTQARVQVLASKAAEAEIEIEKINIRNSELKKEREKLNKGLFTGFKLGKIEIEESINKQALEQYKTILELANKELDDLQIKWLELVNDGNSNGGGGGGKATDIKKVFEKYNENLKELENKLREHAITQEEFNEEFDKLVSKFWEEAAATGKYSIDAILDKMDKGKTLTKMEKWYKDLYEAAREAAKRALLNSAAEDMAKDLIDEVEKAIKAADEAIQKQLEKDIKIEAANLNAEITDKPKRGNRDTTFDYDKTPSTIIGEEASDAKSYMKELEDAINDIISKYDNLEDAADAVKQKLAEWRAELALVKKEASTLEEAMKLAKIQEDIDALNKSINDAVYGGIKNMASSMDRVVKGMESLKKVMEDKDSDGWDVFIALFNQLVQIVDTVISAYETLQKVSEATNKLSEAEIALSTTKISLLEKELALRQAIAAQKAVDAQETQKQAAANVAEAATAKAAASAKASEAVAGATASGSKLPFPANLAAIAIGIGSVLAALASMQKFAQGGVVGGNSYSGDKQLARVNSGEMILNKQQQATLFNAINSGKFGGGEVQFKIRGTDLIGAIKNEQSRRKG